MGLLSNPYVIIKKIHNPKVWTEPSGSRKLRKYYKPTSTAAVKKCKKWGEELGC